MPLCSKNFFMVPISLNPWRSISQRIFDLKPDNYSCWYDENVASAIQNIIAYNAYDYVHCIDNCMTQYCLELDQNIKVVTDHSRIDSEYQLEKLKYVSGLKNKILALEILLKTRWYEKKIHHRYPNHIVCSNEDASYLYKNLGCDSNVLTIVNGFDADSFQKARRIEPCDHQSLLFTGAMDYQPNIDAMLWFCHAILPKILESHPRTVLKIVGVNPIPEIQNLASEHIIVTGSVEDIAAYYRDCDLYICPLRIGGGSRLKLVEAMAMECPILTTRIGAQGLILEDQKHVVFADHEDQFAAACSRLLSNPSQLRSIAQDGHIYAHECYEWRTLLKPLIHYYQDNRNCI